MKKIGKNIISSIFLYLFILTLIGCNNTDTGSYDKNSTFDVGINSDVPIDSTEIVTENVVETSAYNEEIQTDTHINQSSQISPESKSVFSLTNVPEYSGNAYVSVNGNIPYFDNDDLTTVSFENYSPLDGLGRCGVAYACIGQDIMPTTERGSIGNVKPTGWVTVKYDNVDGKYLYNRCHLIGYQLSAENANTQNLITGTRYLNIQGMLPFENMTADYVKETNNHVLYRVTPIFEGNNLLASGVLMEGYSVEDKGLGICFCVYAYNVQPDIVIDYATGNSYSNVVQQTDDQNATNKSQSAAVIPNSIVSETNTQTANTSYILNTNTKKFHYPTCSSVNQMSDKNKAEFNGTREEVIAQGYEACKRCNP